MKHSMAGLVIALPTEPWMTSAPAEQPPTRSDIQTSVIHYDLPMARRSLSLQAVLKL